MCCRRSVAAEAAAGIPCGYGGIGRRARFRLWWSDPCRFKPCCPHQKKRAPKGAFFFWCKGIWHSQMPPAAAGTSASLYVRVETLMVSPSHSSFLPTLLVCGLRVCAANSLACRSFALAMLRSPTHAPSLTSEQSPLCSGFFFCLRQKRSHPPAPLLLLLRKRARSARLLGCKRPRDGSLSLPPFCGCLRFKLTDYPKKGCPTGCLFLLVQRHLAVPNAARTSEQSPLCSGFFFCLRQKRSHPPAPLRKHGSPARL